MLERAQVEHAHGAVGADGRKDVARGGRPRDIVHLAVVRDELRDGNRCGDVPDGAGLRARRGVSGIGRPGEREERTVSMEEVTICVGSRVDQEKEVRGAE